MNFGELKRRVKIGVVRTDLEDLYGDFINEAIREIASRRNWTSMKQVDTVTLTGGQLTVNMPDDFKALTTEKTPIFHVTTDGLLMPCNIYSPEKLGRLNASFGSLMSATTGRDRRLSILVDIQDGLWFIGIPASTTEDISFRVSYFRYFPVLDADTDENAMTRDYPQVIINRAKAIALRLINDEEAEKTDGQYEVEFQKAVRTDAGIKAVITTNRM